VIAASLLRSPRQQQLLLLLQMRSFNDAHQAVSQLFATNRSASLLAYATRYGDQLCSNGSLASFSVFVPRTVAEVAV